MEESLYTVGSEFLVNGAVDLATTLGVSERVISVTMIAVGTSVPELAASVIAALKHEKALVAGKSHWLQYLQYSFGSGDYGNYSAYSGKFCRNLNSDIFWMMGIAFILIPLAFLPKKFTMGRLKGFVLFAGYVVFVSLLFLTGVNFRGYSSEKFKIYYKRTPIIL